MWAGCIWVPIYEVMTRKHLTMVTLQENLEMAADIGIEATTSLDEAFAEAMERHGPDAKVIVLPFARYQLPTQRDPHARLRRRSPQASRPRRRRRRRARTTDPRLDHDRRAPPPLPRRRGGPADEPPRTGRARTAAARFHEPLTMAADAPPNPPRAVLTAFRALDEGGPTDEQVEAARRKVPRRQDASASSQSYHRHSSSIDTSIGPSPPARRRSARAQRRAGARSCSVARSSSVRKRLVRAVAVDVVLRVRVVVVARRHVESAAGGAPG